MATTKIRSSNQLYIDNNLDLNNFKIINVGTPLNANDAVNKAYVDAIQTGLDIKESVKAATTSNLTVTATSSTLTNTGTLAPFSIDGVTTFSIGDRVLIKNQSTGSQNGIYTITTLGSASVAWVLTRASDFDNSPMTEVTSGAFCFVEEGTVNSDSGWVLSTNGTIVIGTTTLTFVQFSGAGQIEAGSGLEKVGNRLNVLSTGLGALNVSEDSINLSTITVTPTTTGSDTGFINSITVDSYGRVTGYNKGTIGVLPSLSVNGTSTLNNLNVTGNTTISGTTTIKGATVINNNLTVTGSSTFNSGIVSYGGTINGGLTVTGTTNLQAFNGGVFTSNVLNGTAPLVIASTTLVSNLNADLLDGNHATYFVNTGRTVTAGSGLSGGGNLSSNITLSHADTSNVDNLVIDNTNGSVIQDLSLLFDGFGHVTGVTSSNIDLDTRYLSTTGKAADADKLDGYHATDFTNAFRKYKLIPTSANGNTVVFNYSTINSGNITVQTDSFELFKNGLLLLGDSNDYVEPSINTTAKTITFTVSEAVITDSYIDVFLLNFSYIKN
jgi:hypothetical protein